VEIILALAGLAIAIWALSALFCLPKRYKNFSYKDQQRAMRAFDRSDQIDMGKPDWVKDKESHNKK
jgi:hypothetical protein